MKLRLDVLGCAGTHPGPNRMCSSYLITAGDYRLLLDCGNGALSNLQKTCDVAAIDAVVISHLHHDHFADIYGLYYALRFHPEGPLSIPIYAPAGAQEFLNQLLGDFDTFGQVCRFSTVTAGDQLQLGPLTTTFFAANHPVEAHATRVELDGTVLAYSGDSAPAPGLVAAARDADMFIADSTWLERQRPLPQDVHMTGFEAGTQAQQANARRLMITHVYPTNDPADVAAEAAQAFDGEILIAEDRMVIEL